MVFAILGSLMSGCLKILFLFDSEHVLSTYYAFGDVVFKVDLLVHELFQVHAYLAQHLCIAQVYGVDVPLQFLYVAIMVLDLS